MDNNDHLNILRVLEKKPNNNQRNLAEELVGICSQPKE